MHTQSMDYNSLNSDILKLIEKYSDDPNYTPRSVYLG